MQFSRLRLSGFKSFVDPTELVIEPGLTGVVGPNGCGKSNLLEALRWVMGENRAKSLRGKGMDDVIFAGTDKRPARGLAEVTLVIDNIERDGPAHYNDSDAIEVTRRIERDSGSAYRINGQDVRQKDVQLMFADAATGAHSPALVSQGRIGSLINAKPQDRRAILEEAAGISGLHSRRKEAEQRLRAAEGNLGRLQDVMQAMEAQAGHLKRQARQAVRYREISQDVEQVEAQILFLRWSIAAEDVIALEKLVRQATSTSAEAAEGASKATRERDAVAAILPDLRAKDAEAAAKLQAVRLQLTTLKDDQRRRAELARSLEGRLEQIAEDRLREQDMERDATLALAQLSEEEQTLKSHEQDTADQEQEAKERLEQASRAASEAEAAYDQLNSQALQAKAQRASLSSDQTALQRRKEQLFEDIERNTRELNALNATDVATVELEAAEANVAELQEALQSLTVKMEGAETAVRTHRDAERIARERQSEAAASERTLTGEIKTLQSLIESQASTSMNPVLGAVRVTAGYESAFAAAFGSTAEASLDRGVGPSWREITDVRFDSLPDGFQSLADVVEGPTAISARLNATWIAPDAQAAEEYHKSLRPGQALVTKEGGLWLWDGFSTPATSEGSAAEQLARKNRLDQLLKDKETADKAVAAASSEEAEARALTEKARDFERSLRSERQSADRDLASARQSAIKAQEAASRRAGRVTSLKGALDRLAAEHEEADERLQSVQQKLEDLPETEGLEAQTSEKRTEVETLRSALASARATHDGLARESSARLDRLTAIAAEITAWTTRKTRAAEQIQSLAARETETKAELAAVQQSPEAIAEEEQSLVSLIQAAEEEKSGTAEALAAGERGAAEGEQALRSAEAAAAQAREAQIRAEAQLENGADKRKEAARQIADRFSCAPTAVLEKVGLEAGASLPDPSVLDAKLEKLKRERDRLGSVNLRADEELTEIETQLEHLTGERSDLEHAIARLRGAIGSLNREGRERLLAAFEIVNTHFGELFQTLFGGGEAHLELTESDDPLEAGLEIFASPPGKKLQALSLLSGGEQALTATSLIFAVFMTNPAPICVLDEVDAPLDDANVDRFCALLDAMIDQTATRFLIVTHNAVTMSRMNRLFGVTMAERGVSKLVSVDLERAETLVEGA